MTIKNYENKKNGLKGEALSISTGFTLFELLITVFIAGLISLLAISNVLSQIPNFKVKEDIKSVEQALKKARSSAIKKSCIINADFSKALNNNGENGGIIEITEQDGTVLDSVTLNHNSLLNQSSSTIQNNIVAFDYRGQPLDSTGATDGFNNTNNGITISYYDGSDPKFSESLTILPITGNISKN